MTLDDLYRILSYGEFSNLALGLEGQGAITEEAQPRVLQHINDGLLRLYSQFILCEKDVLIEMVEGVTNYHLDSQFAESSWDPERVATPYIKDLGEEPFSNDVIKILGVFDSLGRKLPLNDDELPDSLFTPQAKVLQVPHVMPGISLSVLYQAKHPLLVPGVNPATQDVDLPEPLQEALTSFVAWKVYSAMNATEVTNKAREYKARYDEICALMINQDLLSTSRSTTNSRFDKRGWK